MAEEFFEQQYRISSTIQTLQSVISLEVLSADIKTKVEKKLVEFVNALKV
jgi:hypothetical protein